MNVFNLVVFVVANNFFKLLPSPFFVFELFSADSEIITIGFILSSNFFNSSPTLVSFNFHSLELTAKLVFLLLLSKILIAFLFLPPGVYYFLGETNPEYIPRPDLYLVPVFPDLIIGLLDYLVDCLSPLIFLSVRAFLVLDSDFL